MDASSRTRRVEAARGDRPLDLLITNVNLVNVYTREIYPAEIGLSEGYVAYVSPEPWDGPPPVERLDAQGRFAVPGLIDCHTHIESSMMSPAQFAAAVLPLGTTTVVADPHEIGNVLGLRGVRYMLEASADLPLHVYVQAPSCVPAVPGMEVAGAEFGAAEVAEMLSWDRVIGVAEVMDYVGVIGQKPRMLSILDVAMQQNTVISGHCPTVRHRELAAYMMAGPVSDHEVHEREEMLEKLRVGMTVEAKVSSFSESMSQVGDVVRELGTVPPNLVFCTDDIWPDHLSRFGHMDHVVRKAIAHSLAPVDAVRAATLSGAQRHRLHDLGAISPGKRADILLVNDLLEFDVDWVFVGGKLVAQGGQLVIDLPTASTEVEQENTVRLPCPPSREQFVLKARPGRTTERLRVMTFEPGGLRGMDIVELPVHDGIVDLSEHPELCAVAILERHGRTGSRSWSLVRGMGLREGAIASTVAHDSHNLVVAGRDPQDMIAAAAELERFGGGICCAHQGKVVAVLPLPIAGLMTPRPLDEVLSVMQELNRALERLASPRTFFAILGLALPVIPHYGLTDKGLVDVDRQVVLPIWADEE